MGPTGYALEQYKEEIVHRYINNATVEEIMQYLHETFDCSVSESTPRRRLKDWNVTKRCLTKDSPELRIRISILVLDWCLSDEDVLDVLEREGYEIGKWALARIRKEMGLNRRVSVVDRKEADAELFQTVQQELEGGEIEGYGKTNLYAHFRRKGLMASRDRLFAAVKQLDPEGVQYRLKDLQRHRGEYLVPGPNFIWSLDGYCKLDVYGIEIYAAIDAYSRYIVWLYVGVSARTAVSVLKQYLNTVESLRITPKILRSDRGGETPLCANAHFQLRKEQEEELNFQECYFYGTSTANQRIEAWWMQLTSRALYRWRNYFHKLSENNHFNRTSKVDRIAFLAVYMPILREEIHGFVETWNVHRIRKQHNRPNTVVGQPKKLFYYPPSTVKNHGIKVLPDTLNVLQNSVASWDADEYLPPMTLRWCLMTLSRMHLPADEKEEAFPGGSKPHCHAYIRLRSALRTHLASGEEPTLLECERPVGGYSWLPSSSVDSDCPSPSNLNQSIQEISTLSAAVEEEFTE